MSKNSAGSESARCRYGMGEEMPQAENQVCRKMAALRTHSVTIKHSENVLGIENITGSRKCKIYGASMKF